ncbi:MAG: DUF1365 domain-containing protein [Planctomycetota bacterium]|jgi:DUF1365 family protein
MKSCLYQGWVRHRRHAPVSNAFRYSMFMVYLDLAELDVVFAGRWLWSTRRPALAWFRRSDHLGDPDRPLDACVRDLVRERTGTRPTGPIRLLTHLRYFGYVMNPVSFYYCFDADDTRVEHVVAEVHNTPWGERHCYVVPGSGQQRFPKSFHVSPFMGMDQEYRWRLGAPGDRLPVHMENHEDGRRLFDATMLLRRRAISAGSLARVLARHPFMTAKVIAAIYGQAARLWLKRCPFHPHPRHQLPVEVNP